MSNNSKETVGKNRRKFLKVVGAGAGLVAISAATGFRPERLLSTLSKQPEDANNSLFDTPVANAFYQSDDLQKFIQPLRGVGGSGIPVALPDGTAAPVTGVTHYTIDITQYQDTLHPDLGPTTLRGYSPSNSLGSGAYPTRHLGGIIVAKRGTPIQITFTNKLSGKHPIPIDRTLMGAMKGDPGDYQNRTSTHLHGGYVPWISDGGPFSWFDPHGSSSAQKYGDSTPLSIYKTLNPNLKNGQAEYYYPNDQSARMMWYHDHAIGITRMNAYVGIASAYLIRDDFEAKLVQFWGLPNYVELGGYEIPIVIQEKVFVGEDIETTDPTWTGLKTPGSLWYAHTYESARWEIGPSNKTLPDPSVIPEFFGDTMLANGTVYPEATVEPRRYRLRILNATQARFLNLQLYVDDGSTDSITLNRGTNAPTNAGGPDFLVIGTEGGFLPYPVKVQSNVPFNPSTLKGSLITAPAERWDLIMDFKDFAGKNIVLYNDAPAPFPMGDPINDYYPGSPNPTPTEPGFGPDTRQIMRFNVGTSVTSPKDSPLLITPFTSLRAGNDPLPVVLGRTSLPSNVPVRRLTLNETADEFGRLIQLLGTDRLPAGHTGQDFGRAYIDPTTEVITLDPTKKTRNEIWQIINLTGDTHPIHFHLVNAQIISRQPFDWASYPGGSPTFTGAATPPDHYERGWKETVRVNPGEIINVYLPFKLPKVPFKVPPSPRIGGAEYVWHCHILEHEEHDMMRPMKVQ